MSVIGNILSVKTNLTPAEQRLANYILQNPARVLTLSVRELANNAQTSPATVSRFVRHLYIANYNELKIKLSSELNKSKESIIKDPEIKAHESLNSIKKKLLNDANQSMEETADLVHSHSLIKLLQILKKTKQIVCFGIGASYLAAQDIAQKWSWLGYACNATNSAHDVLTIAGTNINKKIFWLISNSGETPEIVQTAKIVNNLGGKVIAITSIGQNALIQSANIYLQTSVPTEGSTRFAATQPLHAQFILIDIIYYSFVSENYDQAQRTIKKSRHAIDNYKKIINPRIK